jgi:hypothetical protein
VETGQDNYLGLVKDVEHGIRELAEDDTRHLAADFPIQVRVFADERQTSRNALKRAKSTPVARSWYQTIASTISLSTSGRTRTGYATS